MNIQTIKHSLVSAVKNLPGKSIGRKVVVIECDDWGSIGMPSERVYRKLSDGGLPVGKSRFYEEDTLEDAPDLEALFSVLKKYQDSRGNYAVMTPFCNMANPDFERIKAGGFQEYYPEVFTETYKRYGRTARMMELWRLGISEGIFVPEYHGREHIAADLWLRSLREGDAKLRMAFDSGFVCYSPPGLPVPAKDFRPNFYIIGDHAREGLRRSMEEGIDLFKTVFGFAPIVFNAPNGVFLPEFNKNLVEKGVRFNAVPRKRLDRNEDGQYRYRSYVTGHQTTEGLIFYVRNCNFEPTDPAYRNTDHVINQINGAFLCGKAAIIGTHRANFVGGMKVSCREKGLSELDILLKRMLKRWPDIEFRSSREFTDLLL